MTQRGIASIAVLVGLILLFAPRATGQGEEDDESVPLGKVEFHYIIFGNVVRNFGGPESEATRSINVLIEEKAFSEDGIKKLFRVLAKGYALPTSLRIYVVTSLEQTHNPGRPRGSDEPDLPAYYEHYWATYIRNGKEELLRYNPKPPSREIKTLSLTQ